MILSDVAIEDYYRQGLISVKPFFDPQQLRPVGIRVHIANQVLIPKPNQQIDLSKSKIPPPEYTSYDLSGKPLTLSPGDFMLASTIETFKVSETLVCKLDGRSTLARLGLLVHCTASVIDSITTEHRTIVLEIANVGNMSITIPARYPIGMVMFESVSNPVAPTHIQSQYQSQLSVTPPKLDFEVDDYLDREAT